jgi:hypothetical protein
LKFQLETKFLLWKIISKRYATNCFRKLFIMFDGLRGYLKQKII